MDFPEAVEYLADKYGIALEFEESSARGDADRRARERLRALLEQATAYYERVYHDAKAAAPAREYLTGRGLSDEVCRAFRVGYSLPGWEKLREAALAKGFGEQDLLDAGLVDPGASAAAPTTASAAASCSRSATSAGARSASAPAPWATRSPSTSTRRRRRSTTRARPCSASTRPRRRRGRKIACTWSRATPTSWPSPRRASPTWWRAWGRP